jgi:hypothetical protein
MLARNGQIVGENSDVVFVNPTNTNMTFHRHWFALRLEKRGGHITYTVDNRLVAEYDDPNPLPGGHIAFWTRDNRLLIARARISYAGETEPISVPPLPAYEVQWLPAVAAAGLDTARQPLATPAPILNDFETDAGLWRAAADSPQTLLALDDSTASAGQQSLLVVNGATGGRFGVTAVPGPFNLRDLPTLSFAYAIPADVKVNLLLKVRGKECMVGFTAADVEPPDAGPFGGERLFPGANLGTWGGRALAVQPPSRLASLGRMEGVQADGKWHTAALSLLGTVERAFPGVSDLICTDLGFGLPDTRSYLAAGFGGNPWGAAYHIDSFRLGP